jgi:hypothetical protein
MGLRCQCMEIVEKRGENACAVGAGLAPPSGVSGKRRNPDAIGESAGEGKCRYDQ